MNRLYRKLRQDLDDVDVASAYFAVSTTAPTDLFAEKLEQIAPGTTVTVEADGQQRQLTIDPEGAGTLPDHPDFANVSDPFAKQLLGKKVDADVQVEDSFGFRRQYKVVAIGSAYLGVARRAAEFLQTSVKPVKGFLSVPVPTSPDGQKDFRHVTEQLRRDTERINSGFEAYAESKLTIGVLATALGTSTVVLCNDWPAKPAPLLYVCAGTSQEREAANKRFDERPKSTVLDLATVAEFVTCGCETALSLIAPALLPQSALDSMQRMIDEAENDRSSGSLREEQGQLVFTEHTAEWKQRRQAALLRIKTCIDKYCIATPAYGPENVPEELRKLGAVLDKEAFDAILIALENDALFITLDGRLREYAAHFGKILGVWPQIVLTGALSKGTIDQPAYSQAILRQLAGRRTHTALSPNDILWVLHQGDGLLQAGIRAIKEHLSDPRVDAISAFGIVADVIGNLIYGQAQLGAVGEVTEHLLGAVLSHPSLEKVKARNVAEGYIVRVLEREFATDEAESRARRQYAWREYLLGAVGRASDLSKLPAKQLVERAPKVRNLFVYRRPLLLYSALGQY
jgi:transcription elongation GreA/GreB family factor